MSASTQRVSAVRRIHLGDDRHRVLEVTAGRDTEAPNALWKTLPEEQRQEIEAVAIDMWQPFENSIVVRRDVD